MTCLYKGLIDLRPTIYADYYYLVNNIWQKYFDELKLLYLFYFLGSAGFMLPWNPREIYFRQRGSQNDPRFVCRHLSTWWSKSDIIVLNSLNCMQLISICIYWFDRAYGHIFTYLKPVGDLGSGFF